MMSTEDDTMSVGFVRQDEPSARAFRTVDTKAFREYTSTVATTAYVLLLFHRIGYSDALESSSQRTRSRLTRLNCRLSI